MCTLTALCSVYCVVSTKQTQRLQTGLRLRDRNAILTSKWSERALTSLIVSTGRSAWERLSRRKLPMVQYANCGTIVRKVCNFTNHEKSGKISAPVQCQARFKPNFEENFFLILQFRCFLWQRNSNAANKVRLFSGL